MEKQFKIYIICRGTYGIFDETEYATDTGIRYRQEQQGTRVWNKKGETIQMPKVRYTFADGRDDQAFFNDLVAVGAL